MQTHHTVIPCPENLFLFCLKQESIYIVSSQTTAKQKGHFFCASSLQYIPHPNDIPDSLPNLSQTQAVPF